jgi:hypothetical protein
MAIIRRRVLMRVPSEQIARLERELAAERQGWAQDALFLQRKVAELERQLATRTTAVQVLERSVISERERRERAERELERYMRAHGMGDQVGKR